MVGGEWGGLLLRLLLRRDDPAAFAISTPHACWLAAARCLYGLWHGQRPSAWPAAQCVARGAVLCCPQQRQVLCCKHCAAKVQLMPSSMLVPHTYPDPANGTFDTTCHIPSRLFTLRIPRQLTLAVHCSSGAGGTAPTGASGS